MSKISSAWELYTHTHAHTHTQIKGSQPEVRRKWEQETDFVCRCLSCPSHLIYFQCQTFLLWSSLPQVIYQFLSLGRVSHQGRKCWLLMFTWVASARLKQHVPLSCEYSREPGICLSAVCWTTSIPLLLWWSALLNIHPFVYKFSISSMTTAKDLCMSLSPASPLFKQS